MYVLKPIARPFTVDALVLAIDAVRSQEFYFAGEMHDFWELVYVVDGQVTVTADEQLLPLHGGDLQFHRPMELHRLRAENHTAPHLRLLSFHASGEGMRQFERRSISLLPEEQAQFNDVFAKCAAAVAAYDTPSYEPLAFCAALALETFLQALPLSDVPSPSSLSAGEQQFRDIVQQLYRHCEQNLSVSDIAALCGYSVSNLKRLFSLYADRGVAKYFLTVKLQRAMQLLQAGMSTAAVAQQLGFSETGYFHTVFRRELGMTPGAYRRSFQHI